MFINLFFHLKTISSDTDFETENSFGFSDGGCTDEQDSEAWHEDVDDLLPDVASDDPLPEPIRPQSSIQADYPTSVVCLFFVILASHLQNK